MDNPQYTEKHVNLQIAKRTPLPISIVWNGDDVGPGESAFFTVVFNEDETKFCVEDNGPSFDISEQVGFRRYQTVGWASGYAKLADTIISIIKEAIADGDLEPAEED